MYGIFGGHFCILLFSFCSGSFVVGLNWGCGMGIWGIFYFYIDFFSGRLCHWEGVSGYGICGVHVTGGGFSRYFFF